MTAQKNNLKIGDIVHYADSSYQEKEIGIVTGIDRDTVTVHWIQKGQSWWADNMTEWNDNLERLT